jgi:Thioredoxin domain-containing protein
MLQEISGDKCFEVLDNNKYILFYFGASWCGPCQQVLPKLEELSKKYDSNIIEFYKVDIDVEENKIICDKCQIKVVPAFLLFNGRKFINRTKGNNIPIIVQMINNILFPKPDIEIIQQKKEEPKIDPYEENRKLFNKEKLFQ